MNQPVEIIIHDKIFCELKYLPSYIRKEYAYIYSYYEPGYQQSPRFTQGFWDGKRALIKDNFTYTYLIPQIILDLTKRQIKVTFKNINLLSSTPLQLLNYNTCFDNIPYKLRDYQVKALEDTLKYTTGVIVAATAAGKTSVMAGMAKTFEHNNIRAIFIVPNKELVTQTAEQFKLLGIDYSIFSGTKKDLSGKNLIATYQSLHRNKAVFENFQAVVVDECHKLTAGTIEAMLCDDCSNYVYRYGLTGTYPKDELYASLNKCMLGDIRYTKPAHELIDSGYISTVEIAPYKIYPSNVLDKDGKQLKYYTFIDYTSQKKYIDKNTDIIEALVQTINSICDDKQNTLILVNTLALGKELASKIENCIFLSGVDKSKERQDVYESYKGAEGIITIATYGIASTGISITNVHNIITIESGKSFSKVIQTIGRGLRKDESIGKTHAVIYDVFINTNINQKHYRLRKQYYKEAKYPVNKLIEIPIHDNFADELEIFDVGGDIFD